MRFLANAFSLNMLSSGYNVFEIIVSRVFASEAGEAAVGATSVVGHPDTAAVFAGLLGREVACNRASVTLASGDEVLVGQYSGPRLPEGATSLPERARIDWLLVKIN